MSYPQPTQVITSSLAASPRCDDQTKPVLSALPTGPAALVDGVLVNEERDEEEQLFQHPLVGDLSQHEAGVWRFALR